MSVLSALELKLSRRIALVGGFSGVSESEFESEKSSKSCGGP